MISTISQIGNHAFPYAIHLHIYIGVLHDPVTQGSLSRKITGLNRLLCISLDTPDCVEPLHRLYQLFPEDKQTGADGNMEELNNVKVCVVIAYFVCLRKRNRQGEISKQRP